jgi:hypothetical protein
LIDDSLLHIGGENGIRTHEPLLTVTHFPGVRLRPLGHLSPFKGGKVKKIIPAGKLFNKNNYDIITYAD